MYDHNVSSLKLSFINFTIIDAIDIFVVALLLWQIYRAIRGTAALTIFVGIFIVYIIWVTVRFLEMELLSLILGQIIGVGVLALLIVFQQEARRYLLMLGNRYSATQKGFLQRLVSGKKTQHSAQYAAEMAAACFAMSATRTGALIAIERTSDLEVYSTTGDHIDAEISTRLIQNIFFKNAPLHDGAMIIKDSRIRSARCILPSSDNPHIPPHLGMRHRAAIGLTEHSDALVIVVSEETGRVSAVEAGKIATVRSEQELLKKLTITE